MARLAPTYEQTCAYCHQAFIPVKRGTQRFCSSSCRTTHCKKKKAGTLGRVTKLKGPGRGNSPTSFAELTLASAAGSLAANTLTQGAEYYAVTKGLVEQVTQLTTQVQRLHAALAASEARQEDTAKLLGRGILTLLTRAGATKAEAWAALHTPFAPLAPVAEPTELPTPAPDALPAAVAAAGITPRSAPRPRARPVPTPAEPAPAGGASPPAGQDLEAGRRP